MAKKGMKRPEQLHKSPRNTSPAVPHQKVFRPEKPISGAYGAIDSDLARDNLENDLTAADKQDLER